MSTYFPKEGEIVRKWYVVDADGQTLGRLASQVARILMGKENPQYTPFLDTGDHVIVINAEKVKTTGVKAEQKKYHHYTGYPGGLRTEDYNKRLVRKPEMVIEVGGEAHAAEEQAGGAHAFEAERIQGRQASAPGAEAAGFETGSARVQAAEGCSFVGRR